MFDPNRKLVNMVAHKFLTHQISKKISSEDNDRTEDASEIADEILKHPSVKEKLDKVVRKADNLEGTVFSQVRHDAVGAIPMEIGEAINVGLDVLGDTFRTGMEGIDTISLGRALSKSLKNLPKPKSTAKGGTRKRKMTNKHKKYRFKKSKKYKKRKTRKTRKSRR